MSAWAVASIVFACVYGGAILGMLLRRSLPEHHLDERSKDAMELGQARWLLVAQSQSSSVPTPFLVILVFWLAILFVSFGLFAPANTTVLSTLFLCAVSVAGAIFLVLELANPYQGLLRVSSAPLRGALALLGQ